MRPVEVGGEEEAGAGPVSEVCVGVDVGAALGFAVVVGEVELELRPYVRGCAFLSNVTLKSAELMAWPLAARSARVK